MVNVRKNITAIPSNIFKKVQHLSIFDSILFT